MRFKERTPGILLPLSGAGAIPCSLRMFAIVPRAIYFFRLTISAISHILS